MKCFRNYLLLGYALPAMVLAAEVSAKGRDSHRPVREKTHLVLESDMKVGAKIFALSFVHNATLAFLLRSGLFLGVYSCTNAWSWNAIRGAYITMLAEDKRVLLLLPLAASFIFTLMCRLRHLTLPKIQVRQYCDAMWETSSYLLFWGSVAGTLLGLFIQIPTTGPWLIQMFQKPWGNPTDFFRHAGMAYIAAGMLYIWIQRAYYRKCASVFRKGCGCPPKK